eukprot:CAMPEP_0168317700 /NCGR_PEP_ID=MMETSP0213-20121227/49_1 /TAXON_ID=151035 /ORGANISM="Euplotes harpa, Strain FSP1.4" /LENGTH=207 /DNA_ID=CAMNT_0008318645 /DNA_START=2814 /DNA_END=3437 /DNA_ORIENTATION=+
MLKWTQEVQSLIDCEVLDKWQATLVSKGDGEGLPENKKFSKNRSDAIWKKILRDARKFYRVLIGVFIEKYAGWDDDKEGQPEAALLGVVSLFYDSIGLGEEKSVFQRELFLYFMSEQRKRELASAQTCDKHGEETVDENVYKYFNEDKLQRYLTNPVYSRLLMTLFTRYGEMYKTCLSSSVKKKAIKIVNTLIKHKYKFTSSQPEEN